MEITVAKNTAAKEVKLVKVEITDVVEYDNENVPVGTVVEMPEDQANALIAVRAAKLAK
jgi:hypothetical protein